MSPVKEVRVILAVPPTVTILIIPEADSPILVRSDEQSVMVIVPDALPTKLAEYELVPAVTDPFLRCRFLITAPFPVKEKRPA